MLPTRVLRALPPTIAQTLRSPPSPEAEITVRGWVALVQPKKHFSFVKLSDGSSREPLQIFVDGGKESGGLRSIVEELTRGTSVVVSGKLVPSPGRSQSHELKASSLTVLGTCPAETYPIEPDKKGVGLDQLRERAHLRMRTEKGRAVVKTRDQVARLFRRYFEEQAFVSITPPILTSSDCEGAGEMFNVEPAVAPSGTAEPFFPPPGANLTVSSQLHLELYLPAHPRVWTLSPCFRAEPSHSSRHLAEFWMLEAEAAFTENLGDIIDVVEGSLKAVARGLLSDEDAGQGGWEVFAQSGAEPRRRVETLAKDVPWTRIAYKEAIDLLSAATAPRFQHRPRLGAALQTEHEKYLAQHFDGPVFVTDYPKAEKSFYMLPNADGETVACFDLLVPEMGELAGGSLREHRLGSLLDVMAQRGMQTAGLEWYLDTRRFGSVPHGGYGLGFERFLGHITGLGSLKDVVGFPRAKGECRY